jgi:hypothetical protein
MNVINICLSGYICWKWMCMWRKKTWNCSHSRCSTFFSDALFCFVAVTGSIYIYYLHIIFCVFFWNKKTNKTWFLCNFEDTERPPSSHYSRNCGSMPPLNGPIYPLLRDCIPTYWSTSSICLFIITISTYIFNL